MKKIIICGLSLLFAASAFPADKTQDGKTPKDLVITQNDIVLKEQVVIGHQVKKMSVGKLPIPLEQTPLTVYVVESKTLKDLI